MPCYSFLVKSEHSRKYCDPSTRGFKVTLSNIVSPSQRGYVYSFLKKHNKIKSLLACQMAQWVKAIAVQADDLSSVSEHLLKIVL